MSGFSIFCPETRQSDSQGCRYWCDLPGLRSCVSRLALCTADEVVLIFRGTVLTSDNFDTICKMNRSSESLIVASSAEPVTNLYDLCLQFRSPLHYFCGLHCNSQPFEHASQKVLIDLWTSSESGVRGNVFTTPVLHYAIQQQVSVKLVMALLGEGADILDADGNSALHLALRISRPSICRALADCQEVRRLTPSGETTLHLARNFDFASILLDVSPGLVNEADCMGHTKLDQLLACPDAKSDTSSDLIQLLLLKGARVPSHLPEGLGEVSKALLEEAMCDGTVAFSIAEPWATVGIADENLQHWDPLRHGALNGMFQCAWETLRSTSVCRSWHKAAWGWIRRHIKSVSWAQLQGRAAQLQLRTSHDTYEDITRRFEKRRWSVSTDAERRAHERKPLTDHRRRPLGEEGCWDVNEDHSCTFGVCLVELKRALQQFNSCRGNTIQVMLTAHALLRRGFAARFIHRSKYIPPDVFNGDIEEHWVFCFEKEDQRPCTVDMTYEVGDEDGVCF